MEDTETSEMVAVIVPLEQVLVNLIKNACEAIGEHGEIRLVTQSNPPLIQIMDNGPVDVRTGSLTQPSVPF